MTCKLVSEIPRPTSFARHPSLATQRNASDDLGSLWSRFRSISVTNFAYLTANANTSAASKSDGISDAAAEEDLLIQSGCVMDTEWRGEMSRCESMPNMDGNKHIVEFDTVSEEDLSTPGQQECEA